jgi:hypothetical protein
VPTPGNSIINFFFLLASVNFKVVDFFTIVLPPLGGEQVMLRLIQNTPPPCPTTLVLFPLPRHGGQQIISKGFGSRTRKSQFFDISCIKQWEAKNIRTIVKI